MPVLTDEKISAFQELKRRGSLSPEQEQAFGELMRRQTEDVGVLNPSAQSLPGSSSDAVAKGLLEMGGMMLGGGVGTQAAKVGLKYGATKIPHVLETLGITAPRAGLVGGVAGSSVGGGLGAVGGEAITAPPNVNLGVDELRSPFLRGAGEGAIAELGGRGVLKLGDMGLKILSNKLSGGPLTRPADIQALQSAEKMGVQLRPAEVTQDDVAAQIEQNARRSMFGKGKFQEHDIVQNENYQKAVEGYADQVFGTAKTPQSAGNLVQDAIKGNAQDFRLVTRGMYKRLSDATGDAPIVETKSAYQQAVAMRNSINPKVSPQAYAIADKVVSELSESGYTTGLKVTRMQPEFPGPTTGLKVKTITGPEGDLQGLKIKERSEGQPIQGPLEGLNVQTRSEGQPRPKNLNFMQAHDIRSNLLDVSRTGEVLPERVNSLSGQLAKTLDTSMEQAATKFDTVNKTNVLQDWRVANASVKSGHELFDSQVIRRALKSSPEDVVNVGFQKNAQTETDHILKVLENDPATLQLYRRTALENLITKSSTQGFLNGQTLFQSAYGKNGIGDAVMEKTFGKDHAAALREMFNVGNRMNVSTLPQNAGNPSQTSRSLINWFEQGMVIQAPITAGTALVMGAPIAAGLAIASPAGYILTVKGLASILNSETGTRMLTKGLTMERDLANTSSSVKFLSRLFTIAGGHAVNQPIVSQPSNVIQPPTGYEKAFENQP